MDGVPTSKRPLRRAAAVVCKEKLRATGTSSRAQNATGLAASQQSLLCSLPLPLTEDVLHKAGPRSRQLCRALALAYGPLPSLTPCGLTRIQDLLSALTRQGRHKQLQALDLTRVPHLVTDSSLKLLLKALPNLQRLHLPTPPKLTAPGFAAAQPLLRSLTSLFVACPPDLDALNMLDAIARMTQLRELALPSMSFASELSKLSACSQLTRLDVTSEVYDGLRASAILSCVRHFPRLMSLSVDAWHVVVEAPSMLQELQALTALTELRLGTIHAYDQLVAGPAAPPSCSAIMVAIGAMTRLRSLRLRLAHRRLAAAVVQPPEGWLTRLSSLTSLDVGAQGEWAPQVPHAVLERVVLAVSHLPALRELRLASAAYSGAELLHGDVFAGLASAGGVLEALELKHLTLPANYMGAVQQLTHLTSLTIHSCNCPAATFSGLAALTGLRKLSVQFKEPGAISGVVFQSLKQLDTLKLDGGDLVDSPYLTSLCAALPQLRVLGIRRSPRIGSGVSALGRLTSLEVLDLSYSVSPRQVAGNLRVPQSLRRCSLVGVARQLGDCQAMAQLLGADVEVVFEDLT